MFVIDDDPSVRRALGRLLRSAGFRVRTFGGGSEFLCASELGTEGCVVLDVRMPGLSGFEVMESLAVRGIDLPVILISGHGDMPMAARARKTGCVSFLAKPFEDEEFLEAIRSALQPGNGTNTG